MLWWNEVIIKIATKIYIFFRSKLDFRIIGAKKGKLREHYLWILFPTESGPPPSTCKCIKKNIPKKVINNLGLVNLFKQRAKQPKVIRK